MDNTILARLKKNINLTKEDLFLLLSVSPFIILILVDSNSFILGWNEGRGPILFGLIFLLLEWRDARETFFYRYDKIKILKWLFFFLFLCTYYLLVYFAGLQDTLRSLAYTFHLPEAPYMLSWTWLWEYLIVAFSIAGMLSSLFSIKILRNIVTPIIYFIGMAAILGLDAAFPYQSPGPLASIIPIIVMTVLGLLSISGVTISADPIAFIKPPWIYNQGNLLFVSGVKRSVILEINWPCAGIMSMLIYILVVCILMVKMASPLKRKLIYASIGAIGTFFVNIFRIFLIAYAVAYTMIDLRIFHETIGEILFVIWIVFYLAIIMIVERRLGGN